MGSNNDNSGLDVHESALSESVSSCSNIQDKKTNVSSKRVGYKGDMSLTVEERARMNNTWGSNTSVFWIFLLSLIGSPFKWGLSIVDNYYKRLIAAIVGGYLIGLFAWYYLVIGTMPIVMYISWKYGEWCYNPKIRVIERLRKYVWYQELHSVLTNNISDILFIAAIVAVAISVYNYFFKREVGKEKLLQFAKRNRESLVWDEIKTEYASVARDTTKTQLIISSVLSIVLLPVMIMKGFKTFVGIKKVIKEMVSTIVDYTSLFSTISTLWGKRIQTKELNKALEEVGDIEDEPKVVSIDDEDVKADTKVFQRQCERIKLHKRSIYCLVGVAVIIICLVLIYKYRSQKKEKRRALVFRLKDGNVYYFAGFFSKEKPVDAELIFVDKHIKGLPAGFHVPMEEVFRERETIPGTKNFERRKVWYSRSKGRYTSYDEDGNEHDISEKELRRGDIMYEFQNSADLDEFIESGHVEPESWGVFDLDRDTDRERPSDEDKFGLGKHEQMFTNAYSIDVGRHRNARLRELKEKDAKPKEKSKRVCTRVKCDDKCLFTHSDEWCYCNDSENCKKKHHKLFCTKFDCKDEKHFHKLPKVKKVKAKKEKDVSTSSSTLENIPSKREKQSIDVQERPKESLFGTKPVNVDVTFSRTYSTVCGKWVGNACIVHGWVIGATHCFMDLFTGVFHDSTIVFESDGIRAEIDVSAPEVEFIVHDELISFKIPELCVNRSSFGVAKQTNLFEPCSIHWYDGSTRLETYGEVKSFDKDIVNYSVPTEPGVCGAGVLNRSGQIFAIHNFGTNGNGGSGENGGILLTEEILEVLCPKN